MFTQPHERPEATGDDYPMAAEAERTLRWGVPALQRYLPFSWANLTERIWLALGKIAPPLYAFRVRSRVFRWYGHLRELEERGESGSALPHHLLEELNTMEDHLEKVIVPLPYANELYALRNPIDMVRQRLLRA